MRSPAFDALLQWTADQVKRLGRDEIGLAEVYASPADYELVRAVIDPDELAFSPLYLKGLQVNRSPDDRTCIHIPPRTITFCPSPTI